MRPFILLLNAFLSIESARAQVYGTELGAFLVDDFVSHKNRPFGLGGGLHVRRIISDDSSSPTVTGIYVLTAQSPDNFPVILNRGFKLTDAVQRYMEVGALFGKYLYLKNGMTIEGAAFAAVRFGQTYSGEERVQLVSGESISTLRSERISEVILEYGADIRLDYPITPSKDQGLSLIIHQNLRFLADDVAFESPLIGLGFYWRPNPSD